VNVESPRFPLMDSLRAIAAISVFFAHGLVLLEALGGTSLSSFLARQDVGVAIFLMISAFLLYRPFVQARYARQPRPALVPFAIRRVLRIVPAYWLALTGVALWLGAHYVFTGEGVLRYYGLLQVYDTDTITKGIGQAWTVCIEITFYLLLPVWAVTASRREWRTTRGFARSELVPLALMFAAGLVWNYWAREATAIGTTKPTPGTYTLPAYFEFFAMGMALAVASVLLWNRPRQPAIVRLVDEKPWLPWAGALVAFWVSGLAGGAYDRVSNAEFVYRHEMNGLTALFLLLPAIFGDQSRGWVRRLLANRYLLWLGMTSYAFYLWHLVILNRFIQYDIPGKLGGGGYLAAAFALSLAVGGASWYGLEIHALRLGRKLSRRDTHIPTPQDEIELTHVPLGVGAAETAPGRE
jgi:peptidoglycan/LPS O-acetylase OafA/YrhL